MTEKKESMIVKKLVEQVQTFDEELIIENVIIDGRKYNLRVSNLRDSLYLEFNEKTGEGHRLLIDKEGIRFAKAVYDAGDYDSTGGIIYKDLIVGISDHPVMGLKKGETYWAERFPYKDEEDFFRVEFEDKKDK